MCKFVLNRKDMTEEKEEAIRKECKTCGGNEVFCREQGIYVGCPLCKGPQLTDSSYKNRRLLARIAVQVGITTLALYTAGKVTDFQTVVVLAIGLVVSILIVP
jgi:hypothetical protein